MPSAYFLAQSQKVEVLILSLPILICTVLLLYLAESRSLMRCGSYIKDQIEASVSAQVEGFTGWEMWLQEKSAGKEIERRSVDRIVAVFFYLLFIFYYLASVALAARMGESKYGVIGFAVTIGVCIAIGGIFLFYLWTGFEYSTRTPESTDEIAS